MRINSFFLQNYFLLLLLLAVSGSLFLHSTPAEAKEFQRFFIKNLENKRFDTRKYRGKPYVMSIFYTKCIPCIKEIPQLYTFMSENFPYVPLLFVDPLDEDSKNDIRKFAKKLNVPSELFYKDSMGIVSRRFFAGGQYAFPTILGLRDLSYLFRFSGIDANILAEIKSKLKE
ncbi:MAG: TlpA family protein disulfide reductase [SAR324 cluster bacterium]|nr:TlpA family protein disulfide reductase [SAR324 cluster bacterium]MBL7034661.1 TlpA family protein disulfide reductase [SAR324 cluster bacterium]